MSDDAKNDELIRKGLLKLLEKFSLHKGDSDGKDGTLWENIFQQSLTMLTIDQDDLETLDGATIYMGSGRQTGVTTWALRKLIENPQSVMIVSNRTLQTQAKISLGNLLEQKTISIDINSHAPNALEDLRKELNAKEGVVSVIQERIITSDDLDDCFENFGEVKMVFLDDWSTMYRNHRVIEGCLFKVFKSYKTVIVKLK